MWKVFVQLFLLSSSESLRLARRQHTVRAQRDFDMYRYFSWFILHQFLCTGVFEFVCIYNLFMYFAISSIKNAIRVGKRCFIASQFQCNTRLITNAFFCFRNLSVKSLLLKIRTFRVKRKLPFESTADLLFLL